MFMNHLPSAWSCANLFISFNTQQQHYEEGIKITSILKFGNWFLERLSNFPESYNFWPSQDLDPGQFDSRTYRLNSCTLLSGREEPL